MPGGFGARTRPARTEVGLRKEVQLWEANDKPLIGSHRYSSCYRSEGNGNCDLSEGSKNRRDKQREQPQKGVLEGMKA